MKRMKCTKRYGTLRDEGRESECEKKAENMTQEMSQITNGHVTNTNNNNNSGDRSGDDGGGEISFVGRCQSALIGAMERGCYRFGVLVAK